MAELLDIRCEKNSEVYVCPMTQFVNLISGKWAIPVLYRLIILNAPVRFGDLLRATAPITQKNSRSSSGCSNSAGWCRARFTRRSHRAWSTR